MNPIVGMVSSWQEGRLAYSAVASLLPACDRVFVLEAPIAGSDDSGDASLFPKDGRLIVRRPGVTYASDAAKRTALLQWVRERHPGPTWGVVLDADEVLLWPELLPDYLYRSDAGGEPGGVQLRIVEPDGQVHDSGARCLRVDQVERYVLSGYQMMLRGSSVVWTAPLVQSKRAPIMGEPHILHRSDLRPPARNVLRQSVPELEALRQLGVKV